MGTRHEWRDCKAWADQGLPLGTVSNEAAKLYDACITQLVGWFDDPIVGGIVTSMEKMVSADPEFVLGRVFNFGLRLMGTLESISSSQSMRTEYEALEALMDSRKGSLSSRELLHIEAVLLWARGKVSLAVRLWEEILLDFPTDIHALKLANISYLYLGQPDQLRDANARVLPAWEAQRPPLTSFVYGLYSYGLEETNEYRKAELYARKALAERPSDGWATHTIAHVFDMEGRITEGLQFMNSTVQEWEKSNHVACHNHWHVALYHVENEDYDSAGLVLEEKVLPMAKANGTMLDILDTTSLIYRLNILNPSSVKSFHWEEAFGLSKSHSKSHVSTFNDVHFMMAFAGSKSSSGVVEEMLESVPISGGELVDHATLTKPLLQAIVDFRDEKYADVVGVLEPLRYRLIQIGGSHAQRDVFNLMLIVAALKSNSSKHKGLARALIHEREATKATPLTRKFKNMVI
ncbi:tetratricopeptide repeat protein 38 [Folsomia candida]|uniref:tetratricopeptide repeat protein 38 n=1 Tax=Folsomia candida TaxID=158441 RepID=UPI001604D894|nr:tetratricopeptide repeat protein 38 [Folsomia candida]XP_035705884.1 tetratricopeptide repeat protein 38 [Folsomia candida]XP_035705889.1 tetratricopeptide repeat protein 38 [Folsomia candida]